MKQNYIFYHMFCTNNCIELFESTFKKIQDHELLSNVEHIYVNLVGLEAERFVDLVKNKHKKIIVSICKDNFYGEMDTIQKLWSFCNQSNNCNILYLHSKGVTHSNNECIRSWVNYMEYFLIEQWNDCIKILDEYDTCGVNLQDHPGKHYSGNFWWANSAYIKKLPAFDIVNCTVPYVMNNQRGYCEFWLTDNNYGNHHCFHTSNINHYGKIYNESNYKL